MTAHSRINPVEELFPIREVVRLTGVNPVTLRAWERRYGLIQPVRTEGGHRQYSAADIETIRRILAWSERGVAVSKVGGVLTQTAPLDAGSESLSSPRHGGDWQEWAALLREAVSAFDTDRLSQLYGHAFSIYPVEAVMEDIFLPVWRDLLDDRRFGKASQWAFLDAFLRARIWQRLQLSGNAGKQKVLLAAIPKTSHELELLVTGLLLSHDECVITVLGPDQPQEEISYVCDTLQPAIMVLFADKPLTNASQLHVLRMAGQLACPVALAGPGSMASEDRLRGTAIASLGASGAVMQRRLATFLSGTMDT
jgi:DNA-binding transcriptional MerR regulator